MIFAFNNKEILFTLVKRLVVLNFAAKTVRAKRFEFVVNKTNDVERKKLKRRNFRLSLKSCESENSIARIFREMTEQEEIVYPAGWNSENGNCSHEHKGAWSPLCPTVLDKNVLKGLRKYPNLRKGKIST